jgi:hypothetical protein
MDNFSVCVSLRRNVVHRDKAGRQACRLIEPERGANNDWKPDEISCLLLQVFRRLAVICQMSGS